VYDSRNGWGKPAGPSIASALLRSQEDQGACVTSWTAPGGAL
jgi:hypothetical protein